MRTSQRAQTRGASLGGAVIGLSIMMGCLGFEPANAQGMQLKPTGLQSSIKAFGFEVRAVYPTKVQGQVTSSRVNWTCKGYTCTTSVKYPGFGVSACHALAMQIGPIRSFRLTKQPLRLVPVKGYPLSAEQIVRCNQGVRAPADVRANAKNTVKGVALPAGRIDKSSIIASGSILGPGANRAKAIGAASNRMKQAKELQRLRDLGSPVDQARGNGAIGRQGCSRSADRAKCLRDNMNAGKATSPSTGGGMSACLMAGGNLSSCFNGGRRGNGSGAGRLSSGPGGATDGARIPGRGQAQSGGKGDGHHWGQWRGNPASENSMIRSSQNDDGSTSEETVTTDASTGNTTRDVFTFVEGQSGGTSQTTRSNAQGRIVFIVTERSTADGTSRIDTKEYGADGSVTTSTVVTHPGPSGQAAPDSASGGAPDNCNWNPALGKCMTNRPNPKGMTSQPGAGGNGGILGRNAPKTDVGAAINCGDANNEACNRAGAGLSNRAKPLEHTDPGPTPGGSPH